MFKILELAANFIRAKHQCFFFLRLNINLVNAFQQLFQIF